IPELLARNYRVRILVRNFSPEYLEIWPEVEIVIGDALNEESLLDALKDVHTAYYLIHSLILGHKKFEEVDLKAATNFRIAAEKRNIKRIIYLGGLGDVKTNLSKHLENRIKVAEKLSSGKIPVTILRAGMIIGSGSASFEILKNLVNNTPVFFIPKWARTRSQPISIRGVIKYLVGVMEMDETSGKNFDIGGPDILTYVDKLKVLSGLLGKKRYFIPGFNISPSVYAFFVSLLTQVASPITKVLVVGCKNEVVCQNNNIKKYLDIDLLSFEDALKRALSNEEMDLVSTRWSDAYPPAHNLALKLYELDRSPRYRNSNNILTNKEPSLIFKSFCMVGGKTGWFHNCWRFRTLGALNRLFMGDGAVRGRRSLTSLRINDVIDFWRVENIIENKLLLLRAEMKISGMMWLEFNIGESIGMNKFSANIYFEPKGKIGVIYWYISLPLLSIIFRKLLKRIERKI
ncbi:SDR family oxidoreductase, partial [Desulfosarcina sp.]|nr:SDR family oxidoreductase [Desulfosarcina sp.]